MTLTALLLVAGSAHAAPVTLNFSGTVDLSASGVPGLSTFSGFITWDSASSPFESAADQAFYDLVAYSLTFNGADATLPILGEGNGNGAGVIDGLDYFEPGVFADAFAFFAAVEGVLPSGNTLILVGALTGPTTMFGSTNLPANLDFLPLLTATRSYGLEEAGGAAEELLAVGTLDVSAPSEVPEPATLGLTALGLAIAAGRARRSRR